MKFRHTYAPTKFNELVFADHRVKLQMSDVLNEWRNPNILLHGPYGSGKSILAKTLVWSRVDNNDYLAKSLVWQASDITRQFLYEHRHFNSHLEWFVNDTSEVTYALIDEVDHISIPLQRELRAFMDKLSPSCALIMTTNEIDNVDGGILSRCEEYYIDHPPAAAWVQRIQDICQQEGCWVSAEAITDILPEGPLNARDMLQISERIVLDERKKPGQKPKGKRQKKQKPNAVFDIC